MAGGLAAADRREALREMGIECPFELLNQLDSLWASSTRAWLRHTNPSQDSNQSRWAVSEVWQVVQGATLFLTEAAPAARVKKIEADATHTLAGFVGFGTSLAARLVVLEKQREAARRRGEQLGGLPALPSEAVGEDGEGLLAWVYELAQGYLVGKKRATFGQVTRRKLAWLGQPQVVAA